MNFDFITPVPATLDQVAEFEAATGQSLPSSYRSVLTNESNGGRLKDDAVRGDDNVGDITIFGIDQVDYQDLARQHQVYAGRVAPGFFAFASSAGGNLLCLSTRATDAGSVWFWDHELEADDGEQPSESNMTHVAASLAELAERCYRFSASDADLPVPEVINSSATSKYTFDGLSLEEYNERMNDGD